MSEHSFIYWFMTSESFTLKSSLTAQKIWYCENGIKITANMVEYIQLGLFLCLCFTQ